MKPTALKCPSCGSSFRAEDLDAARGMLTCSYCRALISIGAPSGSGAAFAARPEVPLPPRIRVTNGERGLEIRRRWFQPVVVFLAFFCVAWDSFLVFFYAMALGEGAPLVMILFPIAHVAVGVGLTYFTLAGFLNTTTIVVGQGELQVSHAPLPWFGGVKIRVSQVDQLYCKRREHRGDNNTSTSYEVWLAQHGARSRKLLSGLPEAEQALFIEQAVERALGLADRAMPDELPR